MRTIKATKITHEEFAPFGQFYNISQPDGYALCGEIHKFFLTELLQTALTELDILLLLLKSPKR